jgi:hypothetical protein
MASTWFNRLLERIESNSSTFSNAKYIMPVDIKSSHTLRLLHQLYNPTATSLYISSTVLRFIMHNNPEKVEPINQALGEMIEKVEKEMAKTKKQLDIILESVPFEKKIGVISYTMPTTYEAIITSPKGRRYLNLFLLLDELIKGFDHLWLQEEITEKDYTQQVYRWRRQIADTSGRIITFVGASMTKAINTNMPELAKHIETPQENKMIDSLIETTDEPQPNESEFASAISA